jgi:hypothetical protein
MCRTCERRSGGGSTAVRFAAGECTQNNTAATGNPDSFVTLIAKLDAAAVGRGVVSLRDGRAVQVGRVAGGYAIGQWR